MSGEEVPHEDQLLSQLDLLEALGDAYFDRLTNSLQQEYHKEEALKDRDEVWRQYLVVKELFEKNLLINVRVGSTEGQEMTESLEELIKKCKDHLTAASKDNEKIKKCSQFVENRLENL